MTTTAPRSGTEWLRHQRTTAAQSLPTVPACDSTDAVDSQVERFLQQHGVRYAPKSLIPIALIDEKSSLGNQARDVPIVPESIERFTASLRKGSYLPPIIVYPSGQRVTIVDGNNRYASHKKFGSTHVPGYVIDEHTPSETIHLLTVAANNDHGVTPDLKWRKRQASHLVSLGFSADKACEAAGVSKAQLSDFQALQRADARALSMRINKDDWFNLSESVRIYVGRIPLDSTFHSSAHAAIATNFDTETARVLLRDIKAASTESEGLSIVARLRTERDLEAKTREATGATNRVSSPKQSLVTALGKLMHIDPAMLASQVLTDHDRTLLIRRCDQAGEKLIELQIALGLAGEARHAG